MGRTRLEEENPELALIGEHLEGCRKCWVQQKELRHLTNHRMYCCSKYSNDLKMRERHISGSSSCESVDSAIDTASFSSDSITSDLSSLQSEISSTCGNDDIIKRVAEVSIHQILPPIINDLHETETGEVEDRQQLEKLADRVTGVPFTRYTRKDVCPECTAYYLKADHIHEHELMQYYGVPDYFTGDISYHEMELYINLFPSENKSYRRDFSSIHVTAQGTPYYTLVTPGTRLSSLPKEAMIPPEDLPFYQATAPVERPWIALNEPISQTPSAQFSVMCYNVLCDKYCTPGHYAYAPRWALNWDFRKRSILDEILREQPTIVSLQEVETEQFYNFFLPELSMHGYSGIFGAKSRARTMVGDEAKFVDGCAIFWKTSLFSYVAEHLVEFNQLAIANAEGSENLLNRVMTKDNVGLCALLETKADIWVNGAPRECKRRILISTAHMTWDPEFSDVKLIQSLMLMSELKNFAEAQRGDNSSCSEIPMILCGDLNSLPDSGVVEFLRESRVAVSHADFREIDYEQVLNAFSHTKDNDFLTHAFDLQSAYESDIMPFTNHTYEFQGVIDYIFYSDKLLNRLEVLGPYNGHWFANNVLSCPHPHIPSDHLSLLARFELPDMQN